MAIYGKSLITIYTLKVMGKVLKSVYKHFPLDLLFLNICDYFYSYASLYSTHDVLRRLSVLQTIV